MANSDFEKLVELLSGDDATNSEKGSSQKGSGKQRKKVLTSKPRSVLEAFEYIVELSGDSNLDDAFFDAAAPHIRYASRKLKLSPMQIVLLSIFIDRSEDHCIRLGEIARYLGCRTIRMHRLSIDIDNLVEKNYLVVSKPENSYRVPDEVLNAIKNNKPYAYVAPEISDLQSFFDYFSSLMELHDKKELTYDTLIYRTKLALESIKGSVYARTLTRIGLSDNDILLFIYMSHLFVEDNDDCIMFHQIESIFDNKKMRSLCRAQFRGRTSPLFTNNLIECENEEGMARPEAFKLTNYAKNELLSEVCVLNTFKPERYLIKSDSFPKKKLIYNQREGEQIAELSSILSEERFSAVQARLEMAGMRKGFCCLFHGAPGTGKTETAFQLARKTGRDIMQVEVDKIKSCWVGESEKEIRNLFIRYRNICRDSELAPILLFNEADAVLGVRMEGATRAVDKMENSLQNIILQEMESLEGIMIATTNLTANLDKAFDRRFLYKVRLERPSIEARMRIWKTMLPKLSDDEANALAAEGDLSGGEIENIVRKHTVVAILSGCDGIDLPALLKLCHSEHIGLCRQRIGFY